MVAFKEDKEECGSMKGEGRKEGRKEGGKEGRKEGGKEAGGNVSEAGGRVELETRECPDCGSKNLISDYCRAEIFCAECGLIIADNIVDLGPEWRAYDAEQVAKKVRVGAPMTYRMHDKGLSTVVSRGGSRGQEQHKIKTLQQRRHTTTNTNERSFIFALSEIDRMACALKLPVNIREAASMLYRQAMKKHLIRGRSIEGITSAILYISCRQCGVPRTLEEMEDISRVEQKEISRSYRFLLRELGVKLSPASPVDFVPRFCSLLELGSETRIRAIEIIKKATEAKLTNGRGPIGIAAAAIYIAAILSGQHRTQKDVSVVTGVTEVTIRNRYKELSQQLNIDILL